jgi:methionine-rich copper-binding protein CopC
LKRRVIAAVAATILIVGTHTMSASAHASLQKCSIKNGQVFRVGHTPKQVTAFFAEELDPKQSWVKLFEGIADHGFVEKEKFVVNFKNPKEAMVTLPALGKEKYYLIWYPHSAIDGHYAAGILYFEVK